LKPHDIVWGYLQTVFNKWFVENLEALSVSDELRGFRESLWHAKTIRDLKNCLSRLIKLYNSCPKSAKNQLRRLIVQTDEFFSLSGILAKDELKSKLKPYYITMIVTDENGHSLPTKLTIVQDGLPICSGFAENGKISFPLLKGSYEVIAVSKGSDWYAMDIVSIDVPAPLNLISITLQKYPRTFWIKELEKPVIVALPHDIQLPQPPANLLQYFDIHEKWMQMCLQYQLKTLGSFAGRKLLDVAHTFTGPSMTRFWKETLHDSVLRKLWEKETDVFMLTEDSKLIGLELKSRKGLEKHDYGFLDAQQYLEIGANEVYLVHRKIRRELHENILRELKAFDKTIGYAIYSPRMLTILKWAESNPLINNPDVSRRNEFLKKNFSKLGGRII